MNERAKAIARIVVAAVVLVNAILTAGGHAPIPYDEGAIYETISNVAVALSVLWVWWKNNNMTGAAISAQNYLEGFKKEYSEEVVEDDTNEAD